MVTKSSDPVNADTARRGSARRRASLVTALALLTVGLAGCGDPDDDGDEGGGGGGYVAAHLTAPVRSAP